MSTKPRVAHGIQAASFRCGCGLLLFRLLFFFFGSISASHATSMPSILVERSCHSGSERVNELTDCFSADTFPSLKRRGGCGINKKARSLQSTADGVVSSAKLFRPKDFADLPLRLRPIGLALRATPSARTKVASRHFLDRASTPPFQGGE